MNARLESVCHGDGKIFLQLVIDRMRPDAFLTLSVFLKDGGEVPAHLFPFRPLDESSQANFVVVLPHFDVREVDLDFEEVGLGDKPLGRTRITAEINLVNWRTRLNTLVRTELTAQMLDIEREYCADRMNIYFTETVDEGEEVIVKMLADMPQDLDADVRVDLLDDYGKPRDLPVYPLMDELVPAAQIGEPDRLQVAFSVRVPKDDMNFTASVYDANGSVSGGFARFCEETYQPLQKLFERATSDAAHDPHYEAWYRFHCATLADLAVQRHTALPYEPLVSLVVPLYDVDRAHMRACLHALELQTYSNFELVVVDACPPAQSYDGLFDRWSQDARLTHVLIDSDVDEATCVLTGLMQAGGEYRGVLDPLVRLAPEALYEFVRRINERLATGGGVRPGLLYANHDAQRADGTLCDPTLKPDYSPDLLCSYDYMGPFVLMDGEIIKQVASGMGFIDEAFRYDLILKAVELAGMVERVDKVLYHVERPVLDSQRQVDALERRRQMDFRGGRRAVGNHYRRLGVDASVVADPLFERYRTRYRLPHTFTVIPGTKSQPASAATPTPEASSAPAARPEPNSLLLTVAIPNRDAPDLLAACVESVLDQKGVGEFEVLIVENGSKDPDTFALYERLQAQDPRVRVMGIDADFSVPVAVNFAARKSAAPYLLLLDNDAEFISLDGMAQLLGCCMRPDVGVVGAKLLFSDDTIQHAGMAVGPYGSAGNLCVNLPGSHPGYMRRLVCASNVSAVSSSCQMIDRALFDAIGGYDERFKTAGSDVDFCLRAIEAGRFVVLDPDVELYHHENATLGHLLSVDQRLRLERERGYLHYKWPQHFVNGDPFMSACLDSRSVYFQLGS